MHTLSAEIRGLDPSRLLLYRGGECPTRNGEPDFPDPGILTTLNNMSSVVGSELAYSNNMGALKIACGAHFGDSTRKDSRH